MVIAVLLLGLLSCAGFVAGDTPGHCLYEDIRGTWTFYETERSADNTVDCVDTLGSGDTLEGPIVYTKTFHLAFPDTATDELGNEGTWTLIYNQGFEININERSYFAFSYYEGDWVSATSYCDRIFNGWSRDTTVRNWSCFQANKTTSVPPRPSSSRATLREEDLNRPYKNDPDLVDSINKVQTSWRAKVYQEFQRYTVGEMLLRGGGLGSSAQRPFPAPPATEDQKARALLLPESFDWRDVDGESYVSPVRDQGGCGSCYAFASMANLESQIRIATKNQRQDVFSTQDPVSCSVLAQGCNGGFDFLIAGRYAQDQGVVAEECNPYTGSDSQCLTNTTCPRTYVRDYVHVGGYYGACNEETMLIDLVTTGPLSVSFQVYSDFHSYDGGIYHHTGLRGEFNPFEITNHVVLIVGYGADQTTGEKYWIVKNSWGAAWGEDGYFRIRRGTDECSIESMAVRVNIIP